MSSSSALASAAVGHAADESAGVIRWAFNAAQWEPTEVVRECADCSKTKKKRERCVRASVFRNFVVLGTAFDSYIRGCAGCFMCVPVRNGALLLAASSLRRRSESEGNVIF